MSILRGGFHNGADEFFKLLGLKDVRSLTLYIHENGIATVSVEFYAEKSGLERLAKKYQLSEIEPVFIHADPSVAQEMGDE